MNIIPQTKDSASYNKNTSGSILLAEESSRKEEVLRIIPLRDKENHNKGKIHLHDLEYYDLTYNCIGLNVSHILGKHPYSFSQALRQIVREIIALTNSQSGGIGFLNFDSDMAKYIREESEEEITESFRECFSDLNCPLRRGSEKAYVTFNFGLDTSPSGRKCSRGLLNAYKLGNYLGRPFQFPNLVFKVKKNINLEEGTPNHDLYLHALKTTGQCMIPTYFNCDSSTNRSAPAENIGIMGCRTRVVDNIYGEKGGIRRGNIAAVTINLVQLAFHANEDMTTFTKLLAQSMDEAKNVLLHRLMTLQEKGDFPYLYSKNLYLDANTGNPEKMLKNGTLSVGFIGLWDALSVLKNQTWTDIESMRPFFHEALEIVKFMRNRVDRYLSIHRQNFSLLASAAEGVCGRFAEIDKQTYTHPVCEKGYYTNSFHVPVSVRADYTEKVELEGAFHALCNGGAISYVELEEMPYGNPEAIDDIIKTALENDCNYIGINFPLDFCPDCGFQGRITDSCPQCKSSNIRHLRRVSGYLAESDKFTRGKSFELSERISHTKKSMSQIS